MVVFFDLAVYSDVQQSFSSLFSSCPKKKNLGACFEQLVDPVLKILKELDLLELFFTSQTLKVAAQDASGERQK